VGITKRFPLFNGPDYGGYLNASMTALTNCTLAQNIGQVSWRSL
jgi:hypothetical protein